ncbi:MAG TPA: NAD-dependent epimerase/dehydratase family protein [Candidatus Dormibacteraeota bacterium]
MTQPHLKTYAQKRVLVTGGLGFIGFNLVRGLHTSNARLSVLSRSWPAVPGAVDSSLQRVNFFKGDIRDPVLVDEAVAGCDVIFHLAGKSGSVASNASPLDDLDVNSRGILTLLDSCRRVNPKVKVVFPSSRLVYGAGTTMPAQETAPTAPLSVYGIHKRAAEEYLLLYERLHGIRTTVLRITNPYGHFQRPEQNRYGIVNWFIHQAMHDRALPVYGDGTQLRDYVHVSDVVDAMLIAGLSPEADGKIFNVGSGRGVSFVEMAEHIIRAAGRGRIEHIPWPADAAIVETGDFVADTTLIAQTLGWKAQIQLDAGIAEVVARYDKLDLTIPSAQES